MLHHQSNLWTDLQPQCGGSESQLSESAKQWCQHQLRLDTNTRTLLQIDCNNQTLPNALHVWSLFFTAPCIPQGVNGTVDCVTNSAWVSWDVDNSTDTYTVLAVGDNGQNSTCISSNSVCHVPDLGCGRRFTFQVTASNGACVSPPSKSFKLETG